MGKHKSVICKTCYRVMHSDVLNRHTKRYEKHVEIEPPPTISTTIPLTYTTSVHESSGYKPTNIDKEMLVNC